jgi:hypothetical protein
MKSLQTSLVGSFKALIHLAEIEISLIRFCEPIGGYSCLANQVWGSGFFDIAKSITVLVVKREGCE